MSSVNMVFCPPVVTKVFDASGDATEIGNPAAKHVEFVSNRK
jgi:hypothetical protein